MEISIDSCGSKVLHRLSVTVSCLSEFFLQKEEVKALEYQNHSTMPSKLLPVRSHDSKPVMHTLVLADDKLVITPEDMAGDSAQ